MTARRTSIALLATAVLMGGALAQGTWHTESGPDRSFTAELPAPPQYTAAPMKTKTGAAYTMHQYLTEQGGRAFLIQYTTYPNEVNVSQPRVNLKNGVDNAAKNMEGGKFASVNFVTHQGFAAVEAVGVRGGSEVRTFSVLNGRRIYVLTYAGRPGSARADDVNRFMGSLRLR